MMWMLLFTLLPLSALAYVGWHVWCLLPLGWMWKVLILALMVGAFMLMFAGIFRNTDRMPMPLAVAVYEVGTSSIIVLLYLFMTFLLLDIGRWVHLVPATFLKNSWSGTLAVTAFMFIIFLYGNIHYHQKVRQPLTLTTGKTLSRKMKVVMLSDLHLGYHNRRSEFAKWVDKINEEKADLILVAGDIIDKNIQPLEEQEMHQEFLRLNAPVIACLGNHEYYGGESNALLFYKKADITLLRDSVTTVGDLCIIGRDDRSNPKRKTLSELMKGVDRTKYLVVLDHQPIQLEEAEQNGIDFQLSGHTHHGQVWPISWITESIYECAFGEWQRGSTRYYVTSGIGIWGGKFRIGTRSEYVVAEITPDR